MKNDEDALDILRHILKLKLLYVRLFLRLTRLRCAAKPERASRRKHRLHRRVSGDILLQKNGQERIEIHAFAVRRVVQGRHELLLEDEQRRRIVRVVQIAQEIAYEG